MAQHLVGAWPLLHIHLQAFVQKILENRRQLISILDLRLPVCRDQIEGAQRILVEIGRLALDHLDGHDAQGPDIHFGPVVLPGDHFRRHPIRRAHHRRPLVLLGGNLRAEAKIGELYVAFHAEEDVVGFNIPMDDVALVEEVQGLQDLATDGGDLALVHAGLGDDIGEAAAW